MSRIKNAALEYLDWGFCVLPVKEGTKQPRISWKKYQEQMPTEEDIEKWFTQWPNDQLALVTGKISNIGVIDIDGPQGVAWAKEHLERPAVWQKTTKGSHLFYKLNGKPLGNNIRIVNEVDIKGEGGIVLIEPSIHPESGQPYKLHFAPNSDWTDLTPFPYDKIPKTDRTETPPVTLEPADKGSRNDTLARIAGKYISLKMTFAEVLTLCKGWNLDLNPPLEVKEVEDTVKSIWKKHQETEETKETEGTERTVGTVGTGGDRRGQRGDREGTVGDKGDSWRQRFDGSLHDELKLFCKENQGSFTISDIDREFGLADRQDKKNRSRVLKKLEEKSFIKKDRRISGKYHILKSDISFISLSEIEEAPFPLDLPLSLSQMVKIPKKCICVVAGTSNAGKTAFLMDVLQKNLWQPHERLYLMSEMGPSEYKQRVKNLDIDQVEWEKKIKAASLSSGYDGPIAQHNPDGLTVVDFLEEIEGEYYKITSDIRSIYDSLGDGVAFIALQKHSKAQIGRGGEGTTEKARLYLTLDKLVHRPRATISALKIHKAKDYPGDNPNGKEIHIEIRAGHEIVPISDWMYCNAKQREQWIAKYEHMVEQNAPVIKTGEKEVVYRFALDDGSYGNLRERDYQKWKKAFPEVDIDEVLSQMSHWSKNTKPMAKKGWFFQLSNILKNQQKEARSNQ